MNNRGKDVQDVGEECGSRSIKYLVKAEIASHPLFKDLLAAHLACIQTVAPANQLPNINPSPMSYASLSVNHNRELDQFMAGYISMLSFLQKKMQACIMEAKLGFESIQHELFKLIGAEIEEEDQVESPESYSYMQDDNDQIRDEFGLGGKKISSSFATSFSVGPEKSLTERMKRELKFELQEDYKREIKHVREDILRRRKACRLPGSTDISSILKKWWEEHQDWPYPTNEEKEMLTRKTGLEPKQINKWFINQRNRHWVNGVSRYASSNF